MACGRDALLVAISVEWRVNFIVSATESSCVRFQKLVHDRMGMLLIRLTHPACLGSVLNNSQYVCVW
jgi:hypothetical protein